MRPPIPMLLLLSVALTLLSAVARGADVCASLPFNTLSFSCGGGCPTPNHLCVTYPKAGPTPCDLVPTSPKSSCVTPPANVSASGSCVLQCFAPDSDPITARFYVLFNATRATRPPSATPTASSADDSTMPPYETNDFVRRVDVLDVPKDIQKVILSGGRDEDSGVRGQVVDLEIDPATFSKAPDLTVVGMLNIDVGNRLPDFPTVVPANVRALDLTNANVQQIPQSINLLTMLDSLSLLRNKLVTVPSDINLPTLRILFLGENSLTSFDTVFPILEFLDLADNKLQRFPSVVFKMPKLHTLKLTKNPDMAKVLFSTSQYAQLSKLEEFSIDAGALDNSSCKSDQVKTIGFQNASVCVVSDEEIPKETSLSPAPTHQTTQSESGGGLSGTVLAIIIVVAALVGVGVGAGAFMYVKKKNRRHEAETETGETSQPFRLAKMNEPSNGTSGVSGSTGSGPFKKARHAALLLSEGSVLSSGQSLWDDEEMISKQLQLEDIEDLRVIGSGGFAIVWLVRYLPQNRLLASKRLIKDQVTRQKTMDFVVEIKLNMQLEHRNIVQLVGVAWTIETDLQALLEYMPNGDLRTHLEATSRSPRRRRWNTKKLQLAIDVVEALVYVHSFSPPLVHRDLKSRNVLLAEDMTAKLCDFGVSRYASANATMTTGVGTGKWLAPEVVAGSTNYDESCDIYAFGVVMSELDTHQLPYEDVGGPQGHKLPEVAVLQMVASGELQPTLSASCPTEIREIAMKCLAFEPSARPTAMEVAYSLRLILKDMASPRGFF